MTTTNLYSPYGVTIAPVKNNPAPMPTQLLSDMAAWGPKVVIRNNYLWRTNETAPGVYNWEAYLDNFVSQCNSAGITALLSINGAPAWYMALDYLGNYIGPTTTTQAYNQNTTHSQINVNPLPAGTNIPNGTQLIVDAEGNQETVTTSAAVGAGATSIPITSWTCQYAHNSGVHVVAVNSILPDPAAMTNYASLLATRYNGQNGYGTIQIFQIGNEEYDSSPNPDPGNYRDIQGKWLALTIQSVAPAIRAAAPSALILAGSVRKVTTNALSHVENWLTNLCTYNGGVSGLIDAVDFHYYRGGSSAGPDPTTSDANTPSISEQLSAMQSVLAASNTPAQVWCCEFGWDMYDDGNGTQTITTAALNQGQSYTSIPVATLPAAIADATPITIDYKAATYASQEVVYAYGQAAKNATSMQITTNPLGSGAAQAAWTAQYAHASGCKVYAQNSVSNIYTQEQVRGWTIEMYDAMRQGGGGMCLYYTDNPASIVHTNANPLSAVETKSLFQSINSVPTYMTAYSNPSQSPGPGMKEYMAQYPYWNLPPPSNITLYARDGKITLYARG
ncbi:MAG TPA: hypothetical protein VKV40_01390 [Ktedonobacteraceae bacterium]|nr:hypothetical protein [Ktedonobacteraceae bacterium]